MISAACSSVHYYSDPYSSKGEDAGFSVSLSPEDVAGLTDNEISTALKSAFAVIQQDLIEQNASGTPIVSGATAIVALVVGKKTFIANAGDSIAMVFRHGGEIEVPFRHSVDDHRKEVIGKAFTTADGKHVKFDYDSEGYFTLYEFTDQGVKRLAGIEPTKGLGDLSFASLLPDWSTPDVTVIEETTRVVLASDGIDKAQSTQASDPYANSQELIIDYSSLSSDELRKTFGRLPIWIEQVPKYIANYARLHKTWDDVLVMATDPAPDAVKLFGVFDGHGGKHVAQYAATHMENAICQQLALQQEKKRQKQAFVAAYDERSAAMHLYAAHAKAKAAARRAAEVTP